MRRIRSESQGVQGSARGEGQRNLMVRVRDFSRGGVGSGEWKEIHVQREDGNQITIDYIFRRNGLSKYSLVYKAPQDGLVVLLLKNSEFANIHEEVRHGDAIEVGFLPMRSQKRKEATKEAVGIK